MRQFRPAKRRIEVSVGDSARILRELQEFTQGRLAELTGIPQSTISAIENGRVNLGLSGQRCWRERSSVIRRCWCSRTGISPVNRRHNDAFQIAKRFLISPFVKSFSGPELSVQRCPNISESRATLQRHTPC
jgi:hypothetical protein